MVECLTLVFAAIAAAGSLLRVAQKERLWRWHKKTYKAESREDAL
jgi:hypothetical protein